MRKSLLKTIVATAVVGATMALTSVAAMAADTVYNFANSSLSAFTFDPDTTPTNQLGADTSDFGGKVTIHGYTDKSGKIQKYKPALVDYTNNANEYLSVACGSGTLADTVFTKAIVSTNGSTADFPFVSVSGIKANDEIEIYYFGADSKGASGKACGFDVKGAATGTGATVAKDPSASTVAYLKTAKATKDGDIEIYPTSGRVAIAAIVVKSASGEEEETLTSGVYDNTAKTGKIVVTADAAAAPSVYVVATVTEGDLALGDKLIVSFNDKNKTTVETDTVYEAIDGVDTANFGGDYYYAVKIEGVSKDADVEQLKAFTFAIVSDIA